MKNSITLLLLPALTVALGSCASAPEKRTKYSDPVMRIMVDPESVPTTQYTRLIQALVECGKWNVVDRAQGWQAIKAEQERMHRTEGDRYDASQKYAMWGKMFGVGGVIVANAQCEQHGTAFFHTPYIKCMQHLNLIDANTGEVITSISHFQEGEKNQLYIAPPWDEAVEKLNKAFPARFAENKKTERLKQFELEAQRHAEEQKRKISSETQPAPAATQIPIEE